MPRNPEVLRNKNTKLHRHDTHGFGLLLHVKQRDGTHHRTADHHLYRAAPAYGQKKQRQRQRQRDHHRATAPDGRHQRGELMATAAPIVEQAKNPSVDDRFRRTISTGVDEIWTL
jgi:hypothetical protein